MEASAFNPNMERSVVETIHGKIDDYAPDENEPDQLKNFVRKQEKAKVQDFETELDVKIKSVKEIVNDVLKKLSREEQARLGFIVESENFTNFMTRSEPAVLVIDGNSRQDNGLSIFSYFSAMLIDSLYQSDSDVVWAFFGDNLHSTFGALGKAMWDMVQLCCVARRTDTTPALKEKYDKQVVKGVESVADMLDEVSTWDHDDTPIVCVIDGVSFVNAASEKALKVIVSKLVKVVNCQYSRFKLLFTSPVQTRELANYVKDEFGKSNSARYELSVDTMCKYWGHGLPHLAFLNVPQHVENDGKRTHFKYVTQKLWLLV